MNTTNILLATTSILIVVAFGLSFGGFSKETESPENQEEIALLKKEMEALEADRRAFELSQLRTSARIPETVSTVAPAPLPVEPGTATTPLADDEREELQAEIDKLREDAEMLEKETEKVYKERNQIKIEQEMAARRVKMALTMGTVVIANKENGLVIFDPTSSAPNHQPGRILAVRRNSGILGEIQIKRLDESGQYVADMRPQVFAADNYPDIIPGDEIIVNPDQ